MKWGTATSTAAPLVDEFLERLRVEDGSSPSRSRPTGAISRAWSSSSGHDGERSRPRGPTDLVAHLEALRRRGLSPRTLARGLAAMRGLYRFGRSANLLRENPAALLETPRLPRRLPRALSKRDATALVESPGDATLLACRDRAMLELLYGLGAAGVRARRAPAGRRGPPGADPRLPRQARPAAAGPGRGRRAAAP